MKNRLDILVVENKLAVSRQKARAMIMEGIVLVNGQLEDKPGSLFPENAEITLKGKPMPYVSRGGLKMEKAIKVFNLNLSGKICMDVGSSTGGFTDCMLKAGASKVYCVDVGYGQLDWKLRGDKRVVCMEKTNIRYLTKDSLAELAEFVSIDVSFISLTKVLNAVYDLTEDICEVVTLIKPQFEAGREKVEKKGVVKDASVHMEVIKKVVDFARETGYVPEGLNYSPIKGPEGNIEFLLYLKKKSEAVYSEDYEKLIEETVKGAHETLS